MQPFSKRSLYVAAAGAAVCALLLSAPWAVPAARAAAGGRALILDTQTGIHDGEDGIVLQSAPFVRAPIVVPQRIVEPAGQGSFDSSTPVIVAPYIRVPVQQGNPPRPVPRQAP